MVDIYTRHKPIRNKIKKFDPTSIVVMGINKIRENIDFAGSPMEWAKRDGTYLPWHVLILIRWVFQYSAPSVNLRQISEGEFNSLYNAIHDINSSVYLEGMPKERPLETAPRRIMFYQLPYQVRKYEIMSSFGRQLIMFRDLGAEKGLDSAFKSHTGLSLREYFDLYIYVWAACESGDANKLSVSYCKNQFQEEVVCSFFNLLSLDLQEAKKFVREDTSPKASIDFQLNEHTPLERYPFFNLNDLYVPYSVRLLDNSFMYNAYDIFKEHNPNFSRDCFGEIFEEYVAKGLVYACGARLYRENQIKAWLPCDSKIADFYVQEDGAAILCDAKSTELHSIARVFQTKESTIRNIRDTIISGVVQVITTAFHLKAAGKIADDNKIFGIIVTYKEYLIGDGKCFWNDIIGETVESELKRKSIKNVIVPEHLFFVSIEDFDYLVAGAKSKNLKLSEVLHQVVERNEKPETAALMLRQHLDDIFGREYFRPDYVTERCEECFDDVKQRFLT